MEASLTVAAILSAENDVEENGEALALRSSPANG